MKPIYIPAALAALAIFGLTAVAQDNPAAEKPEEEKKEPLSLEEMTKRISLGIGFQSGRQAASAGLLPADLDNALFLEGFKASLDKKELEYSDEEIHEGFTALQDVLNARREKMAAENIEAGKKYLEENGKREGVTTTKSGLQYEILTKGNGEKAATDDKPKEYMVHYKGSYTDGKVFDESDGENPVAFPVNGVIPGFGEALALMDKGAKWRLHIPSDLAYGPQGRGDIPPNSVLVFELEVADIRDAAPPQNPGFAIPPQGRPQEQ